MNERMNTLLARWQRTDEEIGRVEALRQLLAGHTPAPDDARCGHTYTFREASPAIRLGDHETRLRRRVAAFLARAEAKERERTA